MAEQDAQHEFKKPRIDLSRADSGGPDRRAMSRNPPSPRPMNRLRKLAYVAGFSTISLLLIGFVTSLSRGPKSGKFVDPPTLIFAYTPVEDPAVYAKVWEGFLQHLRNETGKRVLFYPVQSNAAQLEAMRAGRLHVAGFNTGSTPLAVACAGFEPFAMMASKKKEYGYEMELITYPGSGIKSVEDIKGKQLAFTTQTSNSGFKAPSALLAQRFNMIAGRDYKPVFSGKHDNSILGVANKDYAVAAIANSVKDRMIARNVVKPENLIVIYRSDKFPTTSYGYAKNLEPRLAAKIKSAFFSFDWKGSGLLKEFGTSQPPQEMFMPISYKTHWQVVREIDKALNVSYDCK